MNDNFYMNNTRGTVAQPSCPGCAPSSPWKDTSSALPRFAPEIKELMAPNRMDSLPPMPGGAQSESTSNYEALELSGLPGGNPALYSNPRPGGAAARPTSPELPGLTAIDINNQSTAINEQSVQYLNGFLLTQIGRNCTVTFLIGSNSSQTRSGRLVGVGANYILINEFETNDVVACDFYSIKFVKFYY